MPVQQREFVPRTAVLRLRINDATVWEKKIESEQARLLLSALRTMERVATAEAGVDVTRDEDVVDALLMAIHSTYQET